MRPAATWARRLVQEILDRFFWEGDSIQAIADDMPDWMTREHVEQVIRLRKISPARIYLERVMKGDQS